MKIIRDWNVERERKELENIEKKIKILKDAHNIPPELLPLIERELNRIFSYISIIEVKESWKRDFKQAQDF